jgi:hypothetical protein
VASKARAARDKWRSQKNDSRTQPSVVKAISNAMKTNVVAIS